MALVFFFNDTATTEIYTLSLHDALPISLLMQQAVSPPLLTLSPFRVACSVPLLALKPLKSSPLTSTAWQKKPTTPALPSIPT